MLLTTEESVFYVVRAATVAVQRRAKHASTTVEESFFVWSVSLLCNEIPGITKAVRVTVE
jgi:hypothetical protein